MLWVSVINIMLFYYSCYAVGWCCQYYAVLLFMLCCGLVLPILCCFTIHVMLKVGVTNSLLFYYSFYAVGWCHYYTEKK